MSRANPRASQWCCIERITKLKREEEVCKLIRGNLQSGWFVRGTRRARVHVTKAHTANEL